MPARWSGSIRIPGLLAARTGDYGVPILQSNPRVFPRSEVTVTPVAAKTLEVPWKPEPVPFGDSTREADVLARPVLVGRVDRLRSEALESRNSIGGYPHEYEMGGGGSGASQDKERSVPSSPGGHSELLTKYFFGSSPGI